MRRRKKARFIRAFWHRGAIATEVKTLSDRLEDSFRAFDVRALHVELHPWCFELSRSMAPTTDPVLNTYESTNHDALTV